MTLPLYARGSDANACCAAQMPQSEQQSGSLIAPGAKLGMWVWHAQPVYDAGARADLISFCQRFGINRLFVQVRLNKEGGAYQMENPQAWAAFLAQAHEAGIQVEALDGAGDMGFANNRADTLAKLDAVLAFQDSLPAGEGFSGLHYDIEPYVTGRWKTGDKQQVALELLETMQDICQKVEDADPDLTITHDIPFWYSGRDELAVEFDGETKYLDEHIQDLADGVGIMSYRTKMTGGNSVVAITEEEMAYARLTGGSVYLSLETVPLAETPTITFHGRDGAELIAAVQELNATLQGDPAFGGINLHCYRTLRPMLEPVKPTDLATN
ncbi:MAG: hypothetical protein Q7Q73_19285 [Verrucomicrobiota bacterium JB024]|nr:hypothetical protein [Verrucomicrobiota bacterium JB024]